LKKVLIITYYWPPTGGGGVQRWLKFVKYFREFGWEPIVFTPLNPERPSEDFSLMKEIPVGIQIIQNKIWEPYSYYKKITGRKHNEKIQTAFLSEEKHNSGFMEAVSIWVRGNLFIPDARKFWIKPSIRFLSDFLRNQSVDAIISTGPPHSAHLIASALRKRFSLPWLADFRDPWTNIDYYHDLKLGRRADHIHHQLERQVLTDADAITVVSRGMEREFVSIVDRRVFVIPNGFDYEDVKGGNKKVGDTGKFTLSHIGSLTKTRNAENLWKCLHELVEEHPVFAQKLEIRNVGKIDLSAVESIKKYSINPYLTSIDYMPHEQVITEQQNAEVLLLLINNTPNSKLILTGKLFEYLASRRPIVCIGPSDGDAAAIINETACGRVFDFDDVSGLKEEILRLFNNFLQGNISSSCKNIDRYERKNLTAQMVEVLNEMQGTNLKA